MRRWTRRHGDTEIGAEIFASNGDTGTARWASTGLAPRGPAPGRAQHRAGPHGRGSGPQCTGSTTARGREGPSPHALEEISARRSRRSPRGDSPRGYLISSEISEISLRRLCSRINARRSPSRPPRGKPLEFRIANEPRSRPPLPSRTPPLALPCPRARESQGNTRDGEDRRTRVRASDASRPRLPCPRGP